MNASMNVLRGFALLLVCQTLGELFVRGLRIPLPAPVVGMGVAWVMLSVPALRAPLGAAADVLLTHLSLLFVPVGVGVVAHLSQLQAHGMAFAVVLLLSTWIGLAVTSLVLKALWRPSVEAPRA